MNSRFGLLAFSFGLCLGLAGPAHAAEAVVCETQTATWKRVVYRCMLTAKAQPQSLRFKAAFSGSHDDTELSITLTMDGLPVKCAKGSKTALNGEDGDVSLSCLFAVDGAAGSQRTLNVAVNFYHAQFVGVALEPL